jgi:hypothetical protein
VEKNSYVFADDFFLLIAEHPLGPRIPIVTAPIEVNCNDRVITDALRHQVEKRVQASEWKRSRGSVLWLLRIPPRAVSRISDSAQREFLPICLDMLMLRKKN